MGLKGFWKTSRGVFLLLVVVCFSTSSHALTKTEFVDRVEQSRFRVAEFGAISQKAADLGIRVWLFGGTAATFAHYVRESLIGSDKPVTFEMSDIFRYNQDLDIVVDGDDASIQTFEAWLLDRFSYLRGDKSKWEVRFLKKARGEKFALINNWDFLNQHTDSQSIGLISLTNGPIVSDIIQKSEGRDLFIDDCLHGKIRFLFRDLHEQTSRSQAGLNPPIFAVVRFLTKAFQFNRDISEGDLEIIGEIVSQVSDETLSLPYVRGWLEKNIIKMIQNSQDMEKTWRVLNQIKFKQKLKIPSKSYSDDLNYWLDRQPLPSFSVGSGSGLTLKELALKKSLDKTRLPNGEVAFVVTHETQDIQGYEAIRRSSHTKANVFVSRPGVSRESNLSGRVGFFTNWGWYGAKGSGLQLRFAIDPMAREGTDFILDGESYILVLNANVLKIISHNLEEDALGLLRAALLVSQKKGLEKGIVIESARRLKTKVPFLSDQEKAELFEFVKEHALKAEASILNQIYFSIPLSVMAEEWIDELVQKYQITSLDFPSDEQSAFEVKRLANLLVLMSEFEHWKSHPKYWEWIKWLGYSVSATLWHWGVEKDLVLRTLKSEDLWKQSDFDHFLKRIFLNELSSFPKSLIIESILMHPYWASDSRGVEILETILNSLEEKKNHENLDLVIMDVVLSNPWWAKNPDGLRLLNKLFSMPQSYVEKLNIFERFWGHDDWVRVLTGSHNYPKIHEAKELSSGRCKSEIKHFKPRPGRRR